MTIQSRILGALATHLFETVSPASVAELVERLPDIDESMIRGKLSDMQARGLVRYCGGPAGSYVGWELTNAGLDAAEAANG